MMANDEACAETQPFVRKGIWQYSDWEGEHRNLDVKVAYSVKEVLLFLRFQPGDRGSRKNYVMNELYFLELETFNA